LDIFDAIDSLIAKSMIVIRPVGAATRYRLLDTTRAYLLELSVDNTKFADASTRRNMLHAIARIEPQSG
jgi:predicted ATPase